MNDEMRSLPSTDAEDDFAALLREMPLRRPSMLLDTRIERECRQETMRRFPIG